MPRKNPAAVALGKRGGNANTPAQALARSRNTQNGRRPFTYRLVGEALERCVDGRWMVLEPPYDLAARAFLRRTKGHHA